MDSGTVVNWDRTQSWTPEVLHEPSSESEVAELVRRAVDERKRLKPIGAALSWSDAIDMPGRGLRLSRMARVLEVDSPARLARVQAGARLHDVNEALAEHGLALDNFGSIVTQTAGGYIGTGSHGTGSKTRILSSHVSALRLVDGTGELHELDAAHDPELFSAARVNLGCLGVVTELTVRCVEASWLEERLELIDFDRVLANLDAIVDGNDFCKLWWLPYTREIQVYTFNRTERRTRSRSVSEWLDETGLSGLAFTGLIGLSRRLPGIIKPMHAVVQRIQFRPHARFDRSDRIIRYAGTIPRHQETEYAVPRVHAAQALARVRSMIEAAAYRVNFPLEVRFVAADDIPLSPASEQDSCYLGAYVSSLEWAPAYFADFEELMREYQGRPHWGKTFHRTAGELRALYPGYQKFAQLRRRCDPHGVFRNRFVDRVFPVA